MTEHLDLAPCPFCGERLNLSLEGTREDYYVVCRCCTTTGPNGQDVKSAVIQWNTREKPERLPHRAYPHLTKSPEC